MSNTAKLVKVGLLGCGTVGTEVVRLLRTQKQDILQRCGAELRLVGIVVRDISTPRDPVVPVDILTTNAQEVVEKADLIIEIIGGIEPAKQIVMAALKAGKTVVTGNKALLATHGAEISDMVEQTNANLYYEAAVAGAVPVVYALRESIAGDVVTKVHGIVNGTTNFILDSMTNHGLEYQEAIKIAQERGFAEADPTADVEGYDAASKAAILASLAFHSRVSIEDVSVKGISAITSTDINTAQNAGYVIKLLASCERHSKFMPGDRDHVKINGNSEELSVAASSECTPNNRLINEQAGITVQVSPTLVSKNHPLANVRGAFNAVMVEGEAAGPLMFYGQGAGGLPTASAVMGDVVAGATHIVQGGQAPRELNYAHLPVIPVSESFSAFLITLTLTDTPGTLAKVADIFGTEGVSIARLTQENSEQGKLAVVSIVTHVCSRGSLDRTLEALDASESVAEILSVMPVLE